MGRFPRSLFLVVTATLAVAAGWVAPALAAPAGTRVELKVLLVTDGGPSATALAAELTSEGVPFRKLDLTDADRPVIDAAFLADTVTEGGVTVERAHYQAVVLPNASPFADPAELAALTAYEQRFDIPQVNAYVWPDGSVGLQAPTYSGPLDGVTAAIAPAGATAFGYLNGPVPFEDNAANVTETWGFLAQPAPGAVSTPLVTVAAPDGSAGDTLVAEHLVDGRRQLSLTFSYNSAQTQWRLLAPGIVNWMTGGVHLGLSRNYLSVQVDDVLLGDWRWSTTHNCTPGGDCPEEISTGMIRMTPADVTAAAAWQQAHDFTLDFAYNAGGHETYAEEHDGDDPLNVALLAQKSQFRWTNHTWKHRYLGCERDTSVVPWTCETDSSGDTRWVSAATIAGEIGDNLDYATGNGLPVDASELVTGEHSGLKILPQQPQTNPNLAPELADAGVKWIAADNSRMPKQVKVGPALTVPRYPLNVYYNVATTEEQVDEYNWIYTTRADGGSGICEDNPATVTCINPLSTTTGFQDYIVPLETRFAVSRILGNDPRPHFVHQGNIAEDRLLYPVLESVLSRYRSLLATSAPIVNPRFSAAGRVLQRQSEWADAIADGTVTAYVQDKQVHVEAPSGVDVPLTVPEGSTTASGAFGEAYAGLRSTWAPTAVDVTLP